jgi:hypothetical protein
VKPALIAAAAVVVLFPAVAVAHRLDEYLQATRIAVERREVVVEVDLTPGASVAGTILSRIDQDNDGAMTPHEAESYGRQVVADLALTVNGQAAPLRLTEVEAAPPAEMLEGIGTIRLRAVAPLDSDLPARLDLRFRNDHAPDGSVYLVNALKPGDRRLQLDRQMRDASQREIALEYHVHSQASAQMGWSLLAIVAVMGLMRLRTIRCTEPRKH